MKILQELFGNLATFSNYAPGVETNIDFRDLQPSGNSARKRVETILSTSVFNAILKLQQEAELKEALRSAIANFTMAQQLVFDSIARRKNEVDVYKYEIEAMRRSYMENYYNAIDTMIALLSSDTESEPAKLWKDTPYNKMLKECRIRSAEIFDTIYPIDMSYFFFFRLVPLQKETLDEQLSAYFDKLTDDNSSRVGHALLLALAKKTIAKSLRRFDILEFPPTIRNLFDDSHASRSGKDEIMAAISLADRLDREVEQLLLNVDTLLSTDTTADVSSYSAYNNPDDKIIMLP
ncbi:hypothetical protein CUC00_08460 [Prevotella intermedia]|uniref:hypothetical protein n=1 Tax=Prevotella intermedia TaxID=28131 RepID=UPI000C1BF997|nr:hypothetical protein [Prevotella intermedia]ATV32533.1 hypothetical protein CTM44_01475 [Prevotella intermedia]ATV41056.1 hypothetical protein CUC00_08460 [Prevotella intermedia]